MVSALSLPLALMMHPFSEWQREKVGWGLSGQEGTSLMKSRHMEMDEKWAKEG